MRAAEQGALAFADPAAACRQRLVLGDCAQVLQELPDASIDLTVTSPPYDNRRDYNGHSQYDFPTVAAELLRVTAAGGVVVWVVADTVVRGKRSASPLRQAVHFVDALGFWLNDTMIWQKPNPAPVDPRSLRYQPCFEFMFVLSKGKPKTFNALREAAVATSGGRSGRYQPDGKTLARNTVYTPKPTRLRRNIWLCSVNAKRNGHPAVMPVALAAEHILSWSSPGDTCLDPFLGSGTTGVACKRLGRNFIGIEKDAGYFEIAKRRIAEAM